MKVVYARRGDLLASVLLNFAHAWYFAEKLERRLVLNWAEVHHTRGYLPWFDIYQPQNMFDVVTDRFMTEVDEAYAVPPKPSSSAELSQYEALFYIHTSWARLDGEPAQQADPKIRALLNSMPVHPAVTHAVNSVLGRIAMSGLTAVHIRRGDDVLRILRENRQTGDGPMRYHRVALTFVARYADLETYRRAIQAATTGDLLIFSNDQAEAERLQSMVPDRKSLFIGSLPELASLTPIQRDFAELLLMARASKIVGTMSNYSRFPRLLGDIPLVPVFDWTSPEHLLRLVEDTLAPHPGAREAMKTIIDGYANMLERMNRQGDAMIFRKRLEELRQAD